MEVRSAVLILFSLSALGMLCRSTGELIEADIPAIGRMNFMELCQEFNRSCSEYEVITEDGYILTLHRIRGDETRPVLLWHGIFDSSESSILRGTNSTGISLADAGHDVWAGNSRGNRYSRRHIDLNPDSDAKFWDFSFHEMGVYDMRASIDFILDKTNQEKLAAIGHSQGTSMFFILASEKPIYNELVQPFIAMAPIAHLTNLKPLLKDLIPLWPVVKTALGLLGDNELFRDQSSLKKAIQVICTLGQIGPDLCRDGLTMPIAGYDPEEIELEFMKVIIGRFPAGSSIKLLDHWVQVYKRNRFANYDYGTLGNLKKYGRTGAPDYDLTKVNASVVLLSGANDRISTLEDVETLSKELQNVVHRQVMDRKEFNHIDFTWGRNINVYLNPILKEMLNKYS